MRRLFCFGLGYCAERLAHRLGAESWAIAGTTRDVAGTSHAFDVVPFSRERCLPAGVLTGTTHLLVSIPPDEEGDPALDGHEAELAALGPSLRWVGYLSTTGVYGDHAGGWVDESTPTAPTSPRAARRVAAERRWLASGLPVHVFRLAGIYGPGRSLLDDVLEGTAQSVVKPGQVFSRIHVDDVARVLAASIGRPNPGAIYNVCDDEASPSDAVIAYACGLVGVPVPPTVPFEQADLSPMARSFWNDNKRVSNRRIHEELGVALGYPSYREGLSAIWKASA